MDKLESYRQIIQRILTEYQQWAVRANQPGVKQCLSLEATRDQYLWFHVGWHEKTRDFGVTVYLRIEQGKVWIEEDWTKQGIANDLLDAGIPPSVLLKNNPKGVIRKKLLLNGLGALAMTSTAAMASMQSSQQPPYPMPVYYAVAKTTSLKYPSKVSPLQRVRV